MIIAVKETSGLAMAYLKGCKGTEDLSDARLAQLEIVFETLWAAMEPIFAGDSADETALDWPARHSLRGSFRLKKAHRLQVLS